MVEEELRMIFPILRRRDLLLESSQKSGQMPRDYYLELKKTALDCELHRMDENSLLCHVLVRGLLSSEEKLRENIIVEGKGRELREEEVSAHICSHEIYRHSSRKGETIKKVGAGADKGIGSR